MARNFSSLILAMAVVEGAPSATLTLTDSNDQMEVIKRDDIPLDLVIPLRDALDQEGVNVDEVEDDMVTDFVSKDAEAYNTALNDYEPKLKMSKNDDGSYQVWVELDGQKFQEKTVSAALAMAIEKKIEEDSTYLGDNTIDLAENNPDLTPDATKVTALVDEIKQAVEAAPDPVSA